MNKKEIREEYEHLVRIGKIKKKGKCELCGKEGETHIHHIKAICMGGDNRDKNLIEVCLDCHSAIHNGNNLIKSSKISEKTKEAVRKANTKKYKIEYEFYYEWLNIDIKGVQFVSGYLEMVDFINNTIFIPIINAGYDIKWGKTGKSKLMTIGARKTINAQAEEYDDKYKLLHRDYDIGYIDIYIPNKRGM